MQSVSLEELSQTGRFKCFSCKAPVEKILEKANPADRMAYCANCWAQLAECPVCTGARFKGPTSVLRHVAGKRHMAGCGVEVDAAKEQPAKAEAGQRMYFQTVFAVGPEKKVVFSSEWKALPVDMAKEAPAKPEAKPKPEPKPQTAEPKAPKAPAAAALGASVKDTGVHLCNGQGCDQLVEKVLEKADPTSRRMYCARCWLQMGSCPICGPDVKFKDLNSVLTHVPGKKHHEAINSL